VYFKASCGLIPGIPKSVSTTLTRCCMLRSPLTRRLIKSLLVLVVHLRRLRICSGPKTGNRAV
jgi:hypothetical protein